MFILKNAYLSIIRNKGRNILIGIIIFVIACFCTISLAINNTAEDLINSYESSYAKELSLVFNRQNMKGTFDFSNKEELKNAEVTLNNITALTLEDITNYANSTYIKDYSYTYTIALNGNTIEKVALTTTTENTKKRPTAINALDFTLKGYSSPNKMSEFINGTYIMSELQENAWDIAFNGNYIFINEELAVFNNLNLGDTVKFQDAENNLFEYEILGIYKDNANSDQPNMFSNSANTIITTTNALINTTANHENIKPTINPTFIINSYTDKDTIETEFHEKGLNENYTVSTNEELVNSGLQSVKNVKTFAYSFLIITLIIGGTILLVLNMINIRERKYEIGVFRTIGISKLKLTFKFLTELIIVAIISLTIGAGFGTITSKNISNSLLENEISNSNTQKETLKNNFGGGRMPDFNNFSNQSNILNVSAYNSIDAVVNLKVLLELLSLGISLVLISSLTSMISIQRFSPLTILKERS